MGGTSMKDVWGAGFAGGSSPFRGRERAAVDVAVGPERRRPRHHETCLALESVKERKVGLAEGTVMGGQHTHENVHSGRS